MAIRIQIRRDTAANWTSTNSVLYPGEIGIETDTKKFKFGPTVTSPTVATAWNSIASYANVVPSDLSGTLSDYIEVADLGNPDGPAKLDVDGNLLIPENSIIFEGATADAHELTLVSPDITADKTVTLPNATTTLIGTDTTDTLTNKSISLGSNTVTATLAQLNTAVSDADLASLSGTETLTGKTLTSPVISTITNTGTLTLPTSTDTLVGRATTDTLTNKSISLATNTVTSTLAQLNTAITDADVASLAGAETLTNKSISLASNTITGTLAQFNTALTDANFAPIDSPTFTGTPTLPTGTIATTQTAGDSSTAVATTAFVGTAVANLVDSSPALLNTLDEIAAAIGDDPNFATTLTTSIGLKAPLASPTFTGTVSGVTSTHVGLGNVDNTSDINKPVSTATQTALGLKANIASPTFTGTVAGITATMVGLGNVDNTTDANKPVSTATQTALDLKVDESLFDAKGDLLVASADNTPAKLTVGTNGYLLTANSSATNGVEWAAAPVSLPSQAGNSGYYLTTNGTTASWGVLVVPITTGTATLTANTATTVDTTALSAFTSIEYMVSLKQASKTRTSKVIVQTDGTSVDMTEFAITETGGTIAGVVISATTASTNAVLQVIVTDSTSNNVTVKFSKIAL